MKAQVKLARDMYIAGRTPAMIGTALGVSARTIQLWRKKALKSDDDWDSAKLESNMSDAALAVKEREFLKTLITQFQRELALLSKCGMDSLEDCNRRLEMLNRYGNIYWQLLAHPHVRIRIA